VLFLSQKGFFYLSPLSLDESMAKIRVDITKYGEEGFGTKTMVVCPDDPSLTWHGFVEQAAGKLGLVYNPNCYALSVDESGNPTYLTSLQVCLVCHSRHRSRSMFD